MEEDRGGAWQDDYDYSLLQEYWSEHIEDNVVDKAQDDDRELVEQNRVWLSLSTRQYTVTASGTKLPLTSPLRSDSK